MTATDHRENTFLTFDYAREPFTGWEASLKSMAKAGYSRVHVPVAWGVHEITLGITDFTRNPRLRLEKLLRTVAETGLRAWVDLGPFSVTNAWPKWLLEKKDVPKMVFPKALFENHLSDLDWVEAPALSESEVWEGYARFVHEAFSLLSLYMGVEGPVEKVSLNLLPLSYDLEMAKGPLSIEALKSRYATIDKLNSVYQTRFRGFEDVLTHNGIRALVQKRAWLAAFDHKYCREWTLRYVKSALRDRLDSDFSGGLEIQCVSRLQSIQRDSGEPPAGVDVSSRPKATIWFDGTSIDGPILDQLVPLCPSKLALPIFLQTFSWTNYWFQNARLTGYSVRTFDFEDLEDRPESQPGFRSECPVRMVFCGRYLSRAAFERISLWLDQEGEVLFPLGLPQYDENMQRLEEWNVSACRREESDPMYKLYSFVQRKAKVSFITDCKDPILWPKLIELFGSALGSNPVLPGEER